MRRFSKEMAFPKRRSSIASCLLVLIAAGCAGHSPYRGTTPFVGSFQGTWTETNTGSGKTMNLIIDNSAVVTGTLTGRADGVGTIHGFVTTDGALTGKVDFAGSSTPLKFGGNVVLTGVTPNAPDGGIAGTITTKRGDAEGTVNLSGTKI